jgi:hypothetical protein
MAALDAPASASLETRHELESEQRSRTIAQAGRKNKRKWPKEVSLGEHTSLGPKSYCPDYRTLPENLT